MPAIRLLLLALTLSGFGHAAFAHSVTETATDASATTAVVPDSAARARTLSLIDARGRLEAATPNDRGQRLADVVAVARQRHNDLSTLVDTNPGEFLRVSLPAVIRSGLPAEASTFVEQEADEIGDLEVLHVDHPDPANSYYLHFLRNAKGRFSLHFAGKAPTLATGDRVRVHGVKLDDAIVLAAGGIAPPVQIVGAGLPGTLGAQRTLTILVNFRDAPTQPFTVAYAQNVMLNTTSSFDYEASYQQTTLTGDVAGWFTIAETSATCNYSNISSQAQQAAAAAGFALTNYSRFVYVFPTNSCGWWGLGTVGGSPSHAWVHARYGFNLTVVGHEMGHNLGLYHAHSLDCGTAAVAAAGCVASEYGDVFDIMGGTSGTPHYNAFQKERLGWLNAGASPPLTTVAATPGTSNYTIAPIEDARNTTPRALKIPRSTACGVSTEWFYVESRQARGFDAFLSGNLNVQTGVLIHKVTEGNADSSFLLDMTPATTSWSDAALVAGQTFTDPLTGIGIAPLSVGSASSTVAVTFPPAACARAAPTVTLTPSGTVYASAGASASYSMAVKNNDSCGCGATTFDVSAAVPSGWGATSVRSASVAPAGTVTANLTLTTSSSAPAAFYTVPFTATNSSSPAAAGTVAATVAIAATTFSVTATTDKPTYSVPARNKTVNVAITTKVRNGATAISGATVSVRVTAPGGSITTLSDTTDSNGNAKVTYALRSPGVQTGTYQVTSAATSGGTSQSATASFVVQ